MNAKGKWTTFNIVIVILVAAVGGFFLMGGKLPEFAAAPGVSPGGQPRTPTGEDPCSGNVVIADFSDVKSALKEGTTALNDVNKLVVNGVSLGAFSKSTTKNMAYGDTFTAYYKFASGTGGSFTAGTDYYSAKASGTIDRCGTYNVKARPYLSADLTTWVNNDPSNATTRNAATAQEAFSAGSEKTPTIYLQVATQYAAYGWSPNGQYGILLYADYNGTEHQSITPAASMVARENVGCPSNHTITNDSHDSNQTTCKAWELTTKQLSGIGTYISIPVTLKASATINPQNDVNFFVEDPSLFDDTYGNYIEGWYDDTGTDEGLAVEKVPYFVS